MYRRNHHQQYTNKHTVFLGHKLVDDINIDKGSQCVYDFNPMHDIFRLQIARITTVTIFFPSVGPIMRMHYVRGGNISQPKVCSFIVWQA